MGSNSLCSYFPFQLHAVVSEYMSKDMHFLPMNNNFDVGSSPCSRWEGKEESRIVTMVRRKGVRGWSGFGASVHEHSLRHIGLELVRSYHRLYMAYHFSKF